MAEVINYTSAVVTPHHGGAGEAVLSTFRARPPAAPPMYS